MARSTHVGGYTQGGIYKSEELFVWRRDPHAPLGSRATPHSYALEGALTEYLAQNVAGLLEHPGPQIKLHHGAIIKHTDVVNEIEEVQPVGKNDGRFPLHIFQ